MTDDTLSNETLEPTPAETETLIEFPCTFPIKVVGNAVDGFVERVVQTVIAKIDCFDTRTVSTRPSSQGNFMSVSFDVYVESKAQLDDLYRSLHAISDIRYLL